jgi:hypothetical protein
MIIPEQEHRPVWEPVIIVLCLAALLVYDWTELRVLVNGRAPLTVMARAGLELGVAAMMGWGLLTSLYRAVRWTPGKTGGA